MSLTRIPGGYRVRWRNAASVHKSRTFRHGDGRGRSVKQVAEDFHDEVRFAKQNPRALRQLEAPHKTLADVVAEWEEGAELAPKTEKLYLWLYNKWIGPYFEDHYVAAITPREIEQWLASIDTGIVTKRKAAALLSQFFNVAKSWGYCEDNPVMVARRPKAPPSKQRTILEPLQIEKVRATLLAGGRQTDATLVAVLAYAGLRPQEALALTWEDVHYRTLRVYSPKTDYDRRVTILPPLADDLAAWGSPNSTGPVFPARDGGYRSESSWANWRRRIWHDVAPGIPPYSLRHSFVSLLIHSGKNVVQVAKQAGHSAKVCLDTYAHEFEEWEDRAPRPAEDVIYEARAAVTNGQSDVEESEVFPRSTATGYMALCLAGTPPRDNRLAMREAADGIRTHDLLHGKQTL